MSDIPEKWGEHTSWERDKKKMLSQFQKEGVLISKPSEGATKKKITNIWFDTETQEIVIEHE